MFRHIYKCGIYVYDSTISETRILYILRVLSTDKYYYYYIICVTKFGFSQNMFSNIILHQSYIYGKY